RPRARAGRPALGSGAHALVDGSRLQPALQARLIDIAHLDDFETGAISIGKARRRAPYTACLQPDVAFAGHGLWLFQRQPLAALQRVRADQHETAGGEIDDAAQRLAVAHVAGQQLAIWSVARTAPALVLSCRIIHAADFHKSRR